MDMTTRHAHTLHYCCILLTSGILWTLAAVAMAIWIPGNPFHQVPSTTSLSLHTFPQIPSTNALTGKDIVQQLAPFVVVVHEAERRFFPSSVVMKQACGAGILVYAGHDGCSILTSRHVVDALSRKSGIGQLVGVTMQDGQEAHGVVSGLHRTLDLALIWVPLQDTRTAFAQPLRSFSTVEVGEQIFVIGHPEGLDFSISGGLVSQTRGNDLIQMSAPVSPGNSGGPVFDTRGRLLAIVQSVIDKSKSPNAENLNFAVRADAALNASDWILSREGRAALQSMAALNRPAHDESVLLDAAK